MKLTINTIASLSSILLIVYALTFSSCDSIDVENNKLDSIKSCSNFKINFDVDIFNRESEQIGWGTKNALPIIWNGNSFSGSIISGTASYEVSGMVSENGKTIQTLSVKELKNESGYHQSIEKKSNYTFKNIPYSSTNSDTGDYAFGYVAGLGNEEFVESYSFTHNVYGVSASIDYSDSKIEINFYNK